MSRWHRRDIDWDPAISRLRQRRP